MIELKLDHSDTLHLRSILEKYIIFRIKQHADDIIHASKNFMSVDDASNIISQYHYDADFAKGLIDKIKKANE